MEESKSSADKDKLTVECVGSSEITNKNSFPNKNLTGQKKMTCRRCCVPGCSSRAGVTPDVTFHSFPSDLNHRIKWITVIRMISWKDWHPQEWSVVCNKHFLPSDFRVNLKRKNVLKSAIPSRFPEYFKNVKPPEVKKHEVPANSKQPGLNCIEIIVSGNNTFNLLNSKQSEKISESKSTGKVDIFLVEPIKSSEKIEKPGFCVKDKFTVEPVVHSDITNSDNFLNKLNLTRKDKVKKPQSLCKRKQSLVKKALQRSRISKNKYLGLPVPNKVKECESVVEEQCNVKCSQITNKNDLETSNLAELNKIQEYKSTTSRDSFTMETGKDSVVKNKIFKIQHAITNKSFLNLFSPEIIKTQRSDSVVETEQTTIEDMDFESNIGINVGNNDKCIQVSPKCYDKSIVVSFPSLNHRLKETDHRKEIRYYKRRLQRNAQTIERLKEKLRGTQEEILRYKKDPFSRAVSNVFKHAEDGDQSALYIQNLVLNYKKDKFKCVDIPIQGLISSSKDMITQLGFLGRMIKQQPLHANSGIGVTDTL